MKYKSFPFSRILGERGFLIMPVVVIGLILSFIGGALMLFFSIQNKQNSQIRVVDELENLNTAIVMIFSNSSACGTNLSGGKFGTTLNDLKGPIEIHYPITAGPANGVMVKSNFVYRGLPIANISFSTPVQIRSPDTSYLADLTIEAKDASSSMTRKTIIPFYFTADASGTLRTCLATTYPQPNEVPIITLEDAICRQSKWNSSNPTIKYYYAPIHKTCVVGPVRP